MDGIAVGVAGRHVNGGGTQRCSFPEGGDHPSVANDKEAHDEGMFVGVVAHGDGTCALAGWQGWQGSGQEQTGGSRKGQEANKKWYRVVFPANFN